MHAEPQDEPIDSATEGARARLAWIVATPIVIAAAMALRFPFFLSNFFGSGLTRLIAVQPIHGLTEDQKLVVALTANNIENWTDPSRGLFQLDQCFPFANALALGETMWTGSLLGLPFALFSAEPVAISNGVIVLTSLCAALAMAWLIVDWTGQPAAGLAIGLLYALLGTRTWEPVHIFAWDTTWTVLALLFARRLFEHGRWSDALGLAASGMMQLGASIYPTLGAVLVALPFVPWLFMQRGPARAPWLQLAAVLVAVAGFVLLLFAPYFELETDGHLSARRQSLFLGAGALLPGSPFSPGWLLGGLILVAAWPGLGREGDTRRGDPRLAIAIATVLVLFASIGVTDESSKEPDRSSGDVVFPTTREPTIVYRAVQNWVPGAEVVRFPAAMYGAAHMGFCVLGGLGAAALLRRAGRHRHAVGVGLVAIAFATVTIGGIRWELAEIRPSDETLAFYETLARQGNDGPILDLPAIARRARRITEADYALLSAYHRRPTSGCYNSFVPEPVREVQTLADALPRRAAVEQLRALGFTTAVVHHPQGAGTGASLASRMRRVSNLPGSHLRVIHGTTDRTAFELRAGSIDAGAQDAADGEADADTGERADEEIDGEADEEADAQADEAVDDAPPKPEARS